MLYSHIVSTDIFFVWSLSRSQAKEHVLTPRDRKTSCCLNLQNSKIQTAEMDLI